ncbi:MAG: hypothetical protein F4153_08070 [Acidimicrobiia bacterium]|nr:hypothetical protein [Acidimicrobiia bacterium]
MTTESTSNGSTRTQEAVRQLLYTASRHLDAGEYEQWIGLFTSNGRYRAMSVDNAEMNSPLTIIDDRVETMHDRGEMIDKYWSIEPTRTNHVVSNIEIDFDGDAAADVHSVFVVFVSEISDGRVEIQAMGRYQDRVRDVDGEWRFEDRVAVYDNALLTHPVSLPL